MQFNQPGALALTVAEKYTFVKSTSFRNPQRVVNAVPGDFTHSGKLDLLIMADAGQQLDLLVYPANLEGGFGTLLIIVLLATTANSSQMYRIQSQYLLQAYLSPFLST